MAGHGRCDRVVASQSSGHKGDDVAILWTQSSCKVYIISVVDEGERVELGLES